MKAYAAQPTTHIPLPDFLQEACVDSASKNLDALGRDSVEFTEEFTEHKGAILQGAREAAKEGMPRNLEAAMKKAEAEMTSNATTPSNDHALGKSLTYIHMQQIQKDAIKTQKPTLNKFEAIRSHNAALSRFVENFDITPEASESSFTAQLEARLQIEARRQNASKEAP